MDVLVPAAGDDTLDGGDGIDQATYTTKLQGALVDYVVNLASGIATGAGNDALSGIENVITGGGNDTITGDAGPNVLTGGSRDDTVDGGGGDDVLEGNRGDDTLTGGPGTDEARGGPGVDTCDAEVEVNCEL
jgi:Ca2+-binding RTX toxin-like protein